MVKIRVKIRNAVTIHDGPSPKMSFVISVNHAR